MGALIGWLYKQIDKLLWGNRWTGRIAALALLAGCLSSYFNAPPSTSLYGAWESMSTRPWGSTQGGSLDRWLQFLALPGLLVLGFMYVQRSAMDDGSERKILSWPLLSQTRWNVVQTLFWLTLGCSEFLTRDDGLDVARGFAFTGAGIISASAGLLERQISPILHRLGGLIGSACLLTAAVLGWQEGYRTGPIVVGLGCFFVLFLFFVLQPSSDSSEDEDE